MNTHSYYIVLKDGLYNDFTQLASRKFYIRPWKKRPTSIFCNIFYKTRTILVKYGTLFPE